MRFLTRVAICCVLATALVATWNDGAAAMGIDRDRTAATLNAEEATEIDPPQPVKPLTKEQKAKAALAAAKAKNAKGKASAAAAAKAKVTAKAAAAPAKSKLKSAAPPTAAAAAAPAAKAAAAPAAKAATPPPAQAAASAAPASTITPAPGQTYSQAIAAAAAPATAPGSTVTADNVVATLQVKTLGRIAGVSIEEAEYQQHFQNFMRKHRRRYKTSDLANRYEQYKRNWKHVDDFNRKRGKNGRATYRLAPNGFMDYSPEESKKLSRGFKPLHKVGKPADLEKAAKFIIGFDPKRGLLAKNPTAAAAAAAAAKPAAATASAAKPLSQLPRLKQIPQSKNWADDKTVVSQVRNQELPQSCGSCWAFATAAVVESATAILTGKLIPASAQHLMDCATTPAGYYPCDGCNGGNTLSAFRFVGDHGLCAWDDYGPYLALGDQPCRACKPVHWISNGQLVAAPRDEVAMMAAVNIAPVITAMHAKMDTFKFFGGGLYDDEECAPDGEQSLDHAVVITGYGTTPEGVNYWVIKNSWGSEMWGEAGYMRMVRGVNRCGIAFQPMHPIARLDPNSPESRAMDAAAAEGGDDDSADDSTYWASGQRRN